MEREDFDWEKFMSKEHKDFFDFDIIVGDMVLKPYIPTSSAAGFIRCRVTKIEKDKIYLDDSKVPIQFPGRLVNISRLRTMEG